jgi:Fe-S-cluster containining protein
MTNSSFRYPTNLHFNCSKCGLCCGDTSTKQRHILLTEQDAEHVANATDQPISDFADAINGWEPYIYEMHKAQDGKCRFLQNNQCLIYDHRPLICRFYPFELSTASDGVYVFCETNECPSISNPKPEGKKLDATFFRDLLGLAAAQFGEEL